MRRERINNTSVRLQRRKRRSRAHVSGTAKRPRMSVFRSIRHILVQLIDDEKANTLAYVDSAKMKNKKGTKTDEARKVGEEIGKKAADLGIKQAVFDLINCLSCFTSDLFYS